MVKNKEIRILVVDNNPKTQKVFESVLSELHTFNSSKRMNSHVHIAVDSVSQGEEAILKISKGLHTEQPYAVIFIQDDLTDNNNGIETINKILKVDPFVQAVLCIQCINTSWQSEVEKIDEKDRLHLLKKPFFNVEILQLANSLVKKWQLIQQIKQQESLFNEMVQEKTESLKLHLTFAKATLESTSEAILVIKDNGQIADYNQKFVRLWDLPINILRKRSYPCFLDFVRSKIKDGEYNLVMKETEKERTKEHLYYEIKLFNGTVIECYSLPHEIKGKIIGRVISFRDITERRRVEEQLQHLATYDMLTELPNRTLLLDRINQSITHAKRTNTKFAILFLDLDNFKRVNDTFGHVFGDQVLKEFAMRLKKYIRESDTLARIGGDEFVILLSSLTLEESVTPVIKKIMKKINDSYYFKDQEVKISCSIGVSIYPKNGTNPQTLLKNADIAMYKAKAAGRNTYQFYDDEINENIVKRIQLEVNLYRAIENNELVLYYQPIFDLKKQTITSTEVFLRWNHPKLGLIFPADFIPVAEEVGLITEINEWVLLQACIQTQKWREEKLLDTPISVNLSGYQFHHIVNIRTIKKIFKRTGSKPSNLHLEIKENIILSDPSSIIKSLQELQKLGIGIIIDNFGVGYSSFDFLRRIPISKIKIDTSFMKYINKNVRDENFISGIINLAHSLKIKVVAAGVETQEQVEFLRKYSCDEYQGNVISKPIPLAAYNSFLLKYHK